jgi:hypothetical protein
VTERYEGDGLDFRRPVMSTSTATQTVDRTFIDLTEDDSQPEATEEPFTTRNRRRTEEERWNEAAEIRRSSSRRGDERNERRRLRNVERQQTLARIQYARDHGPRFGRDIIGEEVDDLEVIDLLDSDDTGEVEAEAEAEAEPDLDMGEDLFGDLIDSSPELTFLSERPVPLEGGTRVPSRNNHRRLPTPQNIRRGILPNTFQNLREFVRQGTFGYRGLSENEIDDAREAMDRETLDRIDGIREARPRQRIRELGPFGEIAMFPPRQPSLGRPEVIDMDELELNLDYEAAAFQVGDPDQPEIIEPHVWQGMMGGRGDTPIEVEKEAYTRPKTPANGFTMNMAEDDVLACPSCHDELAVGVEGSAKQQVWMIKSCGHVSCLPFSSSSEADKSSRSIAVNAPNTVQFPSRRRRKGRRCKRLLCRSRSAWWWIAGRL